MRRVDLRFQVRALAFLIAGSALFSSRAGATTILITDNLTFVAATGATDVGAIPFSSSSANFSVGILTFENESPSSVNHDRNWSTKIDEDFDLAINGVENFNVASSVPLFSFGFDFHEPTVASPSFPDTCNATCFDSTFQITLLNGVTPVGSHTFNMPDNVLAFVGVWSSDPFDRIEIRELTDTGNPGVLPIDNEFFGNFLTGDRPLPEPTTLALLGVGLVGLALRRRQRT